MLVLLPALLRLGERVAEPSSAPAGRTLEEGA
jgi:hypothetical protein